MSICGRRSVHSIATTHPPHTGQLRPRPAPHSPLRLASPGLEHRAHIGCLFTVFFVIIFFYFSHTVGYHYHPSGQCEWNEIQGVVGWMDGWIGEGGREFKCSQWLEGRCVDSLSSSSLCSISLVFVLFCYTFRLKVHLHACFSIP